jgi:HEAT repeat protein
MRANIYVSSTFLDLQAYREKVREAIRMLDHTDIAMEYYVAEPLRPVVRCLSDVQRCDLYIGLFARRYGFVPPGSHSSIIEQEFRTSIEQGKDVLCFLLREDAQWPVEFVDQGEAATKLKALRDEISLSHLAGFFSTPDELATKVSAAIVRTLQVAPTPEDVERELRLMKQWRHGASRADRVRARHALINMGSPRYAAVIKDLLLETNDVEHIASYMAELLTLSVNSRQVMPIFVDLLQADVNETRCFAVFQIGELGLRGKEIHPSIVRALTKLEADPSADVRAQLAHTLGKIHHFEEALPLVRACLEGLAHDNDESVRKLAEESQRKVT